MSDSLREQGNFRWHLNIERVIDQSRGIVKEWSCGDMTVYGVVVWNECYGDKPKYRGIIDGSIVESWRVLGITNYPYCSPSRSVDWLTVQPRASSRTDGCWFHSWARAYSDQRPPSFPIHDHHFHYWSLSSADLPNSSGTYNRTSPPRD